jgi:hypothetical protein
MAYFSLHAYDADVWIPAFLGLRQQDESLNTDIRFATDVLNVETPNGVLQPHAAAQEVFGTFEGKKIETLARFYRRFYTGTGSKHWMICAVDGKIYYTQEGSNFGWKQIPYESDFASNVWSWCTYEINPVGLGHSVDVVLMSNALDGMIMITPPDRFATWEDVVVKTWGEIYYDPDEGETPSFTPGTMTWDDVLHADETRWTIETVTTGDYKFSVIERYAERIWGGGIPEHPDRLVYSRPYDPTNWDGPGQDEQPEDCAGEIDQPSWDGDSFTALKAFGNQLIALKEHRVWRVYGTNPGEYVFSEQYGGGAPFFNTIAVDGERIYMADINGLSVYDGMSVQPFQRKLIEPLWRQINRAAMDQMCAVLFQNRYYLAVPMGTSTVNNAMIVLNLEEGSILYYDDLDIESMLSTPDAIYGTSSSVPGKVLDLKYNSWITGQASGGATKWISPWMDFGYKRIQKGGFDLYLTPEVQNDPVTLKISIQTEKKTKSKEYTVLPLTAEQRLANKEHRNKKLHFGGAGRRFRVIIETEEGIAAPWRLIGGLQIVVETDPD